ncbi:MAG: type VI secretion system Vgr family protein, partial [Tepidisphaerales bacterium]
MYEQTDRPIQLKTPLGKDDLLPTEVHGREAISELFHFEVDAVAEIRTEVPFEKLLGQKVTVKTHPKSGDRFINGIVRRVTQGERDLEFTHYRMELVPQFWLLTRVMRSRIFQQKSVPDILKLVLAGLDVAYEIQGDFKSREYCVQYLETDFNFASRLMEEEGIWYFFKHTDGGHTMVLANTPQSHPPIPYGPKVKYEEMFGHSPEDDRVYEWFKGQEIRSGKYTVWDEHFQLYNKHLDADKTIQDSVQVGDTSHKLTAGGGGQLELYEFPGEYSRHFDGIDKSGGEQPDHLQWIFEENVRTVGIRMQQEAVETLVIEAKGSHAGFTSGHNFELDEHFSDNGKFVIVSVSHEARQPIGTGADQHTWNYVNRFTCIPFALPYRPQRRTPIPSVRGVQLATVVGPKEEEIFTDKYGRVKVQFHWDREGKYDKESSCWIRVGSHWAGKQWGAIHIPRIGQEVIVGFEEGDVDHPIIVGSVYNADQMPPYTLPDNKTMSGIRSRSTKKADNDMLNEIRFEDKKDSEHLFMQAQKDMHLRVKNDRSEWVGNDRSLTVDRDRIERIKRDENVVIDRDRIEHIKRDVHLTADGKSAMQVTGSHSLEVKGTVAEKFGSDHSEQTTGQITLKAMNIVLDAGSQISLKVGGNFISIGPSGVTIVGTMVLINSGGASGAGVICNLVSPASPLPAILPITTKPTAATT